MSAHTHRAKLADCVQAVGAIAVPITLVPQCSKRKQNSACEVEPYRPLLEALAAKCI